MPRAHCHRPDLLGGHDEAGSSPIRDIPRVWEIDCAGPATAGGVPWESYEWALETAAWLGVSEVSIVSSTYEVPGVFGKQARATFKPVAPRVTAFLNYKQLGKQTDPREKKKAKK